MYAKLTQLGFVRPMKAGWQAPSQLGHYRLEYPIGRGGMGLVYRARDTSAGERVVALKLLRPELVANPKARARFLREAALASRLDHPNVCGVIDAGEADDIAWIAMRYIEGASLATCIAAAREHCANTPDALPRLTPGVDSGIDGLLRAFEAIADGLAHAHDRGILHRDVKPGNIVVQPDGVPVLLDFGLARDFEHDDGLTMTSDLLGTPAYMAPEQFTRGTVLDGRTDVYALGAALYECLTLDLPHPAPTRDAMVRRIRRDPAPDVRLARPWLPRSVAALVEGALQPDRDQRYGSARSFADDLRRALVRQPLAIRRPSAVSRVRAWVRLNPWPAATGCILALGLAMTLVLVAIMNEHARLARAGHLVGRSLAAQGFDPVSALHHAIAAFDLDSAPSTRDRLHHAMRAARVVARVPVDEIGAVELAFSRDGQRLAVACRHALVVLDRSGRASQRTKTPEIDCALIAETATGFVALLGGADGTIRTWSEQAPDRVTDLPGHRATPRAGRATFADAVLAGDLGRAVFAAADGHVYEVAPLHGAVTRWQLASGGDAEVSRCRILIDGSVVAARQRPLTADAPLVHTDLYRKRADRIDGPIAVRGPAGEFLGVRFLEPGPAAGQVWLGVPFGLVLFDLDTAKPLKRFTTLYDVHSMATAGPFVFAGHNNGVVQRWEQTGVDRPHPIPWHSGLVDRMLAVTEPIPGFGDVVTLVSACATSKRIQLGRGNGWRVGEPLCGIAAAVTAIALDPRGELLATATADGFVQLWRQRDPTPTLLNPTGPFFGHFVISERNEVLLAQNGTVAWRGTPAEQRLELLGFLDTGQQWTQIDVRSGRLARADDQWLSFHDSETGALLAPRVRVPQSTCGVALLGPDQIWLAVNGGARVKPRFQLWEVGGGEMRLRDDCEVSECWDRPLAYWHHARASADGRLFAVACRDGAVRVYGRNGQAMGPPLWHSRESVRMDVLRVAISPDQRRVVSAGLDGQVRSWLRTEDSVFVSEGVVTSFSTPAGFVEFDASGDRIACCSDAGILRVVTTDGHNLLEEFSAGAGLRCCRFAQDGRSIHATTSDGRLLTWFLDHRHLRQRAATLMPLPAQDQPTDRQAR